jgi:hypothetical protein
MDPISLCPNFTCTIECQLSHKHPPLVQETRNDSKKTDALRPRINSSRRVADLTGKRFIISEKGILASFSSHFAQSSKKLDKQDEMLLQLSDSQKEIVSHYLTSGKLLNMLTADAFSICRVAHHYGYKKLVEALLSFLAKTFAKEPGLLTFWIIKYSQFSSINRCTLIDNFLLKQLEGALLFSSWELNVPESERLLSFIHSFPETPRQLFLFVTLHSAQKSGESCTYMKRLHTLANQGDAKAQYRTAICYEEGIVVKRDQKKALKYYMHAATGGIAEAQDYIAGCYQRGYWLKKDHTKADKWYTQAEARGYYG